MKKHYLGLLVLVCLVGLPCLVVGQNEQDVGDLASFGKEAKFFGYALGGTVLVNRDCGSLGFPLGPDDRCFTIPTTTNSVSFDVRDIGRIYFPQKTFQTVIYLLSRHQYSYYFVNFSTVNKNGRFQYRPYFTLESGVLSDPSLINPQTGLPFNGKIDIGLTGGRTFSKTLFPNYQESDILAYGSVSMSGLTKKYFMDSFGLPAQVVDNLFNEKIVIRLNIRGLTTNVEEGTFHYGVRFLGN